MLLIIFIGLFMFWNKENVEEEDIIVAVNSFEECVSQGSPVMESYPRMCSASNGEIFIEDIGNILEKDDLIHIDMPRPNDLVQSPLMISGEARGYWFFEADFPVKITDSNGKIIGAGIARALSAWMVDDFVPYELVLEFENPETEKGTLILERDNPSDLPENDDSLIIPVKFQ